MESLDLYLADLNRLPLIEDPDEEREIARRARAGDEAARERLITANLRFVISYVKKYRGRGLPFEELVALGNAGLVEAVDRFDPDRGVKFLSYAVWWIRSAVQHALVRSRPVRVPQKDHVTTSVRLDAPIWSRGDRLVAEFVGREAAAEAKLLAADRREAMGEMFDTYLTERERKILVLYYGLDTGTRRTLADVAAVIGLSRERIRQIRNTALEKLRKAEDADILAEFTP